MKVLVVVDVPAETLIFWNPSIQLFGDNVFDTFWFPATMQDTAWPQAELQGREKSKVCNTRRQRE